MTSGARAVAASLLVMAALGAYVALEMRVTTDITRFFPAGEARDEVTLAQEITTSELSRTMVLVARAPDEATAVRASRALEAALRAEPTLAGKLAFVEAGPPEGVDRALWELYLPRRLGFVAPSPEAARALTTDAALSAAAERLKERLASPMSTLLSRVAPKDPLLVVPDLFDRAAQSRGDGVAVVDGRFVTGDGKGAVVFLGTVAASFDGAAQKGVLAGIDRAFERARAEVGAELTLLESGANRFAVRAESAIKADITRVTTLSLAGLVLLFLVLFRSPRLVLLTGLPIGAGMLVGTAGCLAVFGAVHGLTLAFGAALIGVSIDYTVHFYSHHALDPDDGGPGATMRRVWPGLLLGAATTVAGFVSLAISSFPGLRELAVFGALGIAGALVATRVFLPVLVPRAPKPVAASRWLAGALDRAVGALRARRALPWALLLAVVALAAVGLPQATWEDDMAKLAERDPDLLREDDAVREQVVRYEQRRFVVALGDTDEAALAVDDRVADVLAAAQGAGEVDGYRALAALLPSAARQAAVREAFVSAPGLGARFDAAFEAAGFAPGAFAGFHEALAEPAPAPLTFADLAASPLAPFVRSFRVGLGDRVAILAFVAGVNAPDALAARLAAAFPGGEARLMDVGEVLSRGYARYRERMVELLGAGLLVVLLLVFLRYRRALPTAAAFLPAILAAVATVAVLALVGQPLNVLSLTALLMVVSMGVDYGVFLAETRGGGAELGATLVALVLACLSTVLGFGLLALSSNPALRSLGLTAGVGVLLSLLLAPTVLVLTRQKEPT
ncbi:MAG: MMPL family transporter [Myxococcales bacterium]|nr:MMPL family transporter [Myxococcales bacterium]MCB9732433.1 MMPL family transporter [Deltaproteobacteria bacterium]